VKAILLAANNVAAGKLQLLTAVVFAVAAAAATEYCL